MSRSLDLSRFRLVPRNNPATDQISENHDRPPGELIWMHATSKERLGALCDIGTRLIAARNGVAVLVTVRAGLEVSSVYEIENLLFSTLPPDLPALARTFLDHWQPDVCLWTGGDLHPTLISLTADRGVDLVLADVLGRDVPTKRHRWLPDQTYRVFEGFLEIYTPSQDVAAKLRRIGVPGRKISVTSRLNASVNPLPCHEDELAETLGGLGGRPVWLATHVEPAEMEVILNAHSAAMRMLHRLLLVLAVESSDDLDATREMLSDSEMRFTDWEAGEAADDNVQIILTCSEFDLGLWYRVAPLSLMAGSLEPNKPGHSPLDAAALGSALLYGPGIRDHKAIYERLTYAGAAVQVGDETALAREVLRLSAPDQSAAMALAGWQNVTEGAELTDRLLDRIQEILDQRESSHAGA